MIGRRAAILTRFWFWHFLLRAGDLLPLCLRLSIGHLRVALHNATALMKPRQDVNSPTEERGNSIGACGQRGSAARRDDQTKWGCGPTDDNIVSHQPNLSFRSETEARRSEADLKGRGPT
jgi:hypothetical protein